MDCPVDCISINSCNDNISHSVFTTFVIFFVIFSLQCLFINKKKDTGTFRIEQIENGTEIPPPYQT